MDCLEALTPHLAREKGANTLVMAEVVEHRNMMAFDMGSVYIRRFLRMPNLASRVPKALSMALLFCDSLVLKASCSGERFLP